MAAVSSVVVPVVDGSRRRSGEVRIALVPRSGNVLWDTRGEPDAEPSLESVQVEEGAEYRYEFAFGAGARSELTTDRPEVFSPDGKDGSAGRLRPGLFTGSLPVTVLWKGAPLGYFAIEVRSRKLDYLSQYRWMLRDVAGQVAELVMERFAPSEQRFEADFSRDPRTLYQRFAFLRSVLEGEVFLSAIQRVLSRPHVAWEEEELLRRPGQGYRGGSAAHRQLAGVARRVQAPGLAGPLGRVGVPELLRVMKSEATVDNAPNRFIKFALQQWRNTVATIGERIGTSPGPAAQRGLRDVEALRGQLDALLAEELFREVGSMTRFPADDQVLQRREGYRDIYHTYVLFEVASKLAWEGGEDVYAAGQKNVATLYEYWTFLQLARCVAAVCEVEFDWSQLVSVRRDGFSVELKRGDHRVLKGTANRLGRKMTLELWFNRTFGSRTEASWSLVMRPDCSLLIRLDGDTDAVFEPVWLHFDAKYRVETLMEVLSELTPTVAAEEALANEADEAEGRGEAKHADLLKMHAYRDAIRRSAGAYVLYPGTETKWRQEYHELLPGLGAFALRPSYTGEAVGSSSLTAFLRDVVDHVASQVTQHERGRFWVSESYSERSRTAAGLPAAAFLTRPPADTTVLLGFVRGTEHRDWIRRTKRYNIRADDRTGGVRLESRALAAELLVLYEPRTELVQVWTVQGVPELATTEGMIRLGYPDPRGHLYFCLPLGGVVSDDWAGQLTLAAVLDVRRRVAPFAEWGEPVPTTWLELVRAGALTPQY